MRTGTAKGKIDALVAIGGDDTAFSAYNVAAMPSRK